MNKDELKWIEEQRGAEMVITKNEVRGTVMRTNTLIRDGDGEEMSLPAPAPAPTVWSQKYLDPCSGR